MFGDGVKTGKAPNEQIISRLPLIADIQLGSALYEYIPLAFISCGRSRQGDDGQSCT